MKGVNIGDVWIVVLLYADDICILTENEADLQKALNIVHDWCTRCYMTVNTDKIQIAHFRTPSKERTGSMCIYGEQNINVVSQVRWDSTIFHSFSITKVMRQGSVISPLFLTLYVDELIDKLEHSGYGCKIGDKYYGILIYADDIFLLSLSAYDLQKILNICSSF